MQRLVAIAIATLIATPALAAGEPAMRLKLNDLDLTTQDGAKTALARITKAAQAACSSQTTGSRMKRTDAVCVSEMTSQAVKKLNAATVTALHESEGQAVWAGKVKQGS